MKRKKNVTAKALSLLLSLVMVVSLLPVTAAAAGTSGESGIKLDKTVELTENGTYTITLEAYATG